MTPTWEIESKAPERQTRAVGRSLPIIEILQLLREFQSPQQSLASMCSHPMSINRRGAETASRDHFMTSTGGIANVSQRLRGPLTRFGDQRHRTQKSVAAAARSIARPCRGGGKSPVQCRAKIVNFPAMVVEVINGRLKLTAVRERCEQRPIEIRVVPRGPSNFPKFRQLPERVCTSCVKQPKPRCGELNRQWQAMEPPANRADQRGVGIRQREIFDDRCYPLHEKPHGGRGRRLCCRQPRRRFRNVKRSKALHAFTRYPQRLPAGRHNADARRAKENRRRRTYRRVNDVLATVEHQQRPVVP